MLNWKNGTKTLFWQEEPERRRRREEEEEDGGGSSSRHLYVVWCVGNAFTCKVSERIKMATSPNKSISVTKGVFQCTHKDTIISSFMEQFGPGRGSFIERGFILYFDPLMACETKLGISSGAPYCKEGAGGGGS